MRNEVDDARGPAMNGVYTNTRQISHKPSFVGKTAPTEKVPLPRLFKRYMIPWYALPTPRKNISVASLELHFSERGIVIGIFSLLYIVLPEINGELF